MLFKIQLPWSNSSTKNQYIAIFIVNILTLIHGCAIGWTSPMIPYLKSNGTHLDSGVVSTYEVSWIGSLMFLGALIGILTAGIVADTIGTKKCLVVMTFPSAIFWIRTVVSTDVFDFYIARTVAGLTGGALLRIVPLFIDEIADIEIRRELNAYSQLSMSFGILLMFIIGTYISYFIIPFIIVPILVIYFILMMFLPETPQYLLKKMKDKEALQSLKFYRNCNRRNFQKVEAVKNELDVMRKCVYDITKEEVQIKDFFDKSSIYGLIVSLFLGIIVSCSGYITILTYTTEIFKSSGSSLASNQSSIIMAFSYFIGICISRVIADKLEKKTIISICSAGSGLSLLVLAVYLNVAPASEMSEYCGWIPVASLACALFLQAIGISSISTSIVTELVPKKIQDKAAMMFLGTTAALTFVNLKVFPILIESINLSTCMFIYAGICLLSVLFSIFILPATKGNNQLQSH